MREAELRGISPRRWVRTTASDPAGTMVTDLVNRQFKASAPDRLWVADITYGTVSEVIPVNLVIRGCPPTQVDLLRGLTWLLSRP
jgi:Ni,Fe-hydrogenase III small subunit